MKILLISFEFPPQHGGIGTYSYQIAKNLQNFKNDVTVLVHTSYSTFKEIQHFDKHQNFRIVRFKNYRIKFIKIIHRICFSLKLIGRKSFDVIFIPYSHAGLFGFLFRKLFGIPYVMTGHGSELLYKSKFLRAFIKIFFNNADLVFANSNYTLGLMRKMNIINKKAYVVPLGADDFLFDREIYDQNLIRKKYGLENRKIILTVGSLSLRKGHRIVIEAVDKLKNDIPNLLYLIVGKGRNYESLKKFIHERKLDKYVRLEGFVSLEKLPEYYALSDIFILNSTVAPDGDVEGFGIVLVEAALMGKPVIGTRDCGIEEVIEENKTGLLVPMDSPRDTAEAIKKLFDNNTLREEMGNYSYNLAKEKFTWERTASETEKILKYLFTK